MTKSNASAARKSSTWVKLGELRGLDLFGPPGYRPMLRRDDEPARKPKLRMIGFAREFDMSSEADAAAYADLLSRMALGRVRVIKNVEQWVEKKSSWKVFVAGWESRYEVSSVGGGYGKSFS